LGKLCEVLYADTGDSSIAPPPSSGPRAAGESPRPIDAKAESRVQ
jgi:hypothetical protein